MTTSVLKRTAVRYQVNTRPGERDEYAEHLAEHHPEAAHALDERRKHIAEATKQDAYWNRGESPLGAAAIAVLAMLTRPRKLH